MYRALATLHKDGWVDYEVVQQDDKPDKKVYETVDGVPREDWIYFNRGMRADFITFEDGVVIRIKRY